MLLLSIFQPKGSKKFIDKKKATTFHVVHRSQRDPLAADEKAPQHVLVAATDSKKVCSKQSPQLDSLQLSCIKLFFPIYCNQSVN